MIKRERPKLEIVPKPPIPEFPKKLHGWKLAVPWFIMLIICLAVHLGWIAYAKGWLP